MPQKAARLRAQGRLSTSSINRAIQVVRRAWKLCGDYVGYRIICTRNVSSTFHTEISTYYLYLRLDKVTLVTNSYIVHCIKILT